jgi:hypothetical protein
MATVEAAVVADAMRSQRTALTLLTTAYGFFSALACAMLLCVEITRAQFWAAWIFWRFFLTVVNLLVAYFFYYFAVTTCGACRSPPSMFSVVFGIIHFIWCLVVIGFTVADLINCAALPWCTVAPAVKIDTYYLLWVIGFFGAAVLEAIMCFVGGRLFAMARAACPSPCSRYAGGGGGFLQAGSGYGDDTASAPLLTELPQRDARRAQAPTPVQMQSLQPDPFMFSNDMIAQLAKHTSVHHDAAHFAPKQE